MTHQHREWVWTGLQQTNGLVVSSCTHVSTVHLHIITQTVRERRIGGRETREKGGGGEVRGVEVQVHVLRTCIIHEPPLVGGVSNTYIRTCTVPSVCDRLSSACQSWLLRHLQSPVNENIHRHQENVPDDKCPTFFVHTQVKNTCT